MIVILQRVSRAKVTAEGSVVGGIEDGLLALAGVFDDDEMEDLEYCARKCAELRIFPDEDDNMNLSVSDVSGKILVVSNFTLCADIHRGRRPSFTKAMKPPEAEDMVNLFIGLLKDKGIPVETGSFGAKMDVDLTNDGPVTIIVDSR